MPLIHVEFFSQVLAQHSAMDVLLPTEQPGQCFPGAHLWPTLYLLHGLSDSQTAWQRWSSLERYLWDIPVAVVMPTTLRGFYTDMKYGPRYFTFISEELPALCEKLFHLSPKREDRFAAGLSMGGYGAFKLGLRCPERYAAVASLSGALDVAMHSNAAFDYPSLLPEYALIFGEEGQVLNSADDLFALAACVGNQSADMPRFYQVCGTEDMLYRENALFHERFQHLLALEYHEAKGEHNWAFWDLHIQEILRWLPLRERTFPTEIQA